MLQSSPGLQEAMKAAAAELSAMIPMCSSLDQNLFHSIDFTSKNALQIPDSIYGFF
jgi:hypothetical protein